MNILILSAGTRDKIVQFFKKELEEEGRVIATDCSAEAPALYEADRAYLVPRIDTPGYIDRILGICRKEQIDGVFSLIDPELSLLAEHRDRFLAVGTTPVVSSCALCEASLDKLKMADLFSRANLATARSYRTPEDFRAARARGEIDLPVFVKPRYGSASLGISRVENEELLTALMATDHSLIAQEYLRGQEYGADVYVDMLSGKCTHIFLKKKLKMRAGETDKAVSVRDGALFADIARFSEEAGFRGMIDIDLFHGEDPGAEDYGRWTFSEVNPRFGGGYPHAYACGVNFPAAVLANLRGLENKPAIGDYEEGIYMMKYNETMILRGEDLV